jgi:sphingolipid delta-4 desaturase
MPLIGEFKEPKTLDDYLWVLDDQPHFHRRMQMLKKYPQVKELFGTEWKTKWLVSAVVLMQLCMGYYLREDFFTWKFWIIVYFFGATCNHCMFLAVHEISHFLAFKTFWHNKALNLLTNIPLVFPVVASFKPYHVDHHRYLGVDGMDTDLPTTFEGKIFRGVIGKIFFLSLQSVCYAIRPLVIRKQVITSYHMINWTVQLTFDAIVLYYVHWGMLAYLTASTLVGMSLHPCAAHFIAEHYAYAEGVETYSYYGILNVVSFNSGYHNEHHDFPNVPWTNLPKLRAMCPEFYETMPQHTSWVWVMWKFITDPNIGVHNRIKRLDTTNAAARPCGAIKND